MNNKNFYFFVLCAICILFFFACKTTKKIENLTDDDIKIMLQKGGCFGNCPIYTIKVYEGGYVHFDGRKHIDKLGTYHKTLSKAEYAAMVEKFETSNFTQFKDEYKSDIPDLPMVRLSYKNEKAKDLKTVKGKMERPETVKELQLLLEKLVAGSDWTLIKKLEEEKPPSDAKSKATVNKSEIIIEPNQGINLPRWFSEKKEKYGIRIINKIAPNLNLWLITYDKQMVDGDTMLTILKNDEGIKSAQFNTDVSPRKEP